jgi:hypothetical protein
MQFGHFDDARREYVITTPETPYPWINYLGNDAYFGIISNTAGGYSFYRDARLRRVTRYRYNNIPVDNGGRYFYINDGGDVWNPGWKPSRTPLDTYECRHGLGYTTITGARNGVCATLTATVPLKFNGEVYRLTLKNTSGQAKSLKLFSFLEWCLWDANDDALNFQRNFSTGEVEVVGSAIYHKTEYRERRNHYAFYWANQAVDGFDTDRKALWACMRALRPPRRLWPANPPIPWPMAGSRLHPIILTSRWPTGRRKPSCSCSLCGKPQGREMGKQGGHQQDPCPGHAAAVQHAGEIPAGAGRSGGVLGQPVVHLCRAFLRGETRSHGEHLESLPVHGHLQHVPFCLLL